MIKTTSYASLALVLGLLTTGATFLHSAGWLGSRAPAPLMTSPALLQTDSFYFYAQKEAELYRGELMTHSEMKRFVQQAKGQIRLWNAQHPNAQNVATLAQLDDLQDMPYNVAVNQQTLKSLEHFDGLEKSLQVHVTRLLSVADSYQD